MTTTNESLAHGHCDRWMHGLLIFCPISLLRAKAVLPQDLFWTSLYEKFHRLSCTVQPDANNSPIGVKLMNSALKFVQCQSSKLLRCALPECAVIDNATR